MIRWLEPNSQDGIMLLQIEHQETREDTTAECPG